VDAFRSVLIVLPRGPTNDENYSRFIERTRTCSYNPPFCAPRPPPPYENLEVPASPLSCCSRRVELTRSKYTLNAVISANMCCRMELQTHASSAHDNYVTLTFDLLTSGSVVAERLPCTMSINLGVDSSSGFPDVAKRGRFQQVCSDWLQNSQPRQTRSVQMKRGQLR